MKVQNIFFLFVIISGSCFVILEIISLPKKSVPKDMSSVSTEDYISFRHKLGMHLPGNNWRRQSMMIKVEDKKEDTTQRFMTIGIPTVRRQHSSYFLKTLDSLLNCTSKKHFSEIIIVIFLADFNITWRYEMAKIIGNKYVNLVNNGTIQVIEAPREFYPPLENLNHTYNDNEDRRKWRSKQNIDYVFLWLYSQHLSKYYMQLEDDVFTIPEYLDIIKEFIAEQKSDWTCLEFSELGFIGKVYHSKYLERLAQTVVLFYEEQPVDYTFLYFNILNLQTQRIIRRPTLFQHVGYHSSLAGKIQPLKDKYFDFIKKTLKGDNPPAKLVTTLKISPDFPLQMAYSPEDGYFWAHSAPTIKDSIYILFNEPQELEKVIIISGSREHPSDIFYHAQLDACLGVRIFSENNIECFNIVSLGSSANGTIVAPNLQKKLNSFKVSCLKLSFTKSQQWWLIVKEIAVYVINQ